MFKKCKALQSLGLSSFRTDSAKTFGIMFAGSINLLELYLPNFKSENVDDIEEMFKDCNNLK